jgi:hypothetical protein
MGNKSCPGARFAPVLSHQNQEEEKVFVYIETCCIIMGAWL